MSMKLGAIAGDHEKEYNTRLSRKECLALLPPIEYGEGRTKQAFKDECDIVKILSRAQKAGTLSHLEKYEPVYGDFADFDFMEANLKLTQGREVFDQLPSELRAEFKNSPAKFFEYVNNPKNADKLREKLPALAMPGRQNVDVTNVNDVDKQKALEKSNEAAGVVGDDAKPPPEPPPAATE